MRRASCFRCFPGSFLHFPALALLHREGSALSTAVRRAPSRFDTSVDVTRSAQSSGRTSEQVLAPVLRAAESGYRQEEASVQGLPGGFVWPDHEASGTPSRLAKSSRADSTCEPN